MTVRCHMKWKSYELSSDLDCNVTNLIQLIPNPCFQVCFHFRSKGTRGDRSAGSRTERTNRKTECLFSMDWKTGRPLTFKVLNNLSLLNMKVGLFFECESNDDITPIRFNFWSLKSWIMLWRFIIGLWRCRKRYFSRFSIIRDCWKCVAENRAKPSNLILLGRWF